MNPVDNSTGVGSVNAGASRNEVERGSNRGAAVRDSQASGAAAQAAPDAESVTLTQAASELLQLDEQLRALPDADRERVETIRRAIADGSYEVDARRIVDSLLQSEAELR
jgi:negative regulator of flagellin synthesis FlgM